MLLDDKSRCLIEAGLYVAGEDGLALSDLCNLLQKDKEEAKIMLDELAKYYAANENCAFDIKIFDNRYKLLTKASLNQDLMRLAHVKYRNPLTKNLMEVLAIIAYNGPITKRDIERIKPGFKKVKIDEEGNSNMQDQGSCDYALHRLRELELIEPIISNANHNIYSYKVTGKFLDVFGLKSIRDLPKINRSKLLLSELEDKEQAQEKQ